MPIGAAKSTAMKLVAAVPKSAAAAPYTSRVVPSACSIPVIHAVVLMKLKGLWIAQSGSVFAMR